MFVILYCGKDSDSLTDLIYLKYMKMASSSRTIKIESLPPTSRVENTNGNYPGSKTLGLELEHASFVPVMTDEEPAPDELVNIRWCNCQVTLKNLCSGSSVFATPMGLSA